jgi:hypothetical protein
MDIGYISGLSALAGSVVGGLTSGFTTWLSQRAQAMAGQFAHDKSQREDLYKDFIVAASKVYGDAVVSDEPQIQELVALYAMISRMRVLSFPRTVACAEKIVRREIIGFVLAKSLLEEASHVGVVYLYMALVHSGLYPKHPNCWIGFAMGAQAKRSQFLMAA